MCYTISHLSVIFQLDLLVYISFSLKNRLMSLKRMMIENFSNYLYCGPFTKSIKVREL